MEDAVNAFSEPPHTAERLYVVLALVSLGLVMWTPDPGNPINPAGKIKHRVSKPDSLRLSPYSDICLKQNIILFCKDKGTKGGILFAGSGAHSPAERGEQDST